MYGTTQRNTTATAGFSIMHTENFDKLGEIFQPKKKTRKQKKEYIEFDEGTIPTNKEEESLPEADTEFD